MNKFDAIVVGSGPSGTMCASQLLKKNIKVLMIDYGLTIEEKYLNLISELKNLDKQQWNYNIRKKLFNNKDNSKDLTKKFHFGSDYIFRDSTTKLGILLSEIEYQPTISEGGLSNIWGGSLYNYNDEDLSDWPIKHDHLEKYYEIALNYIGLNNCYKNKQIIKKENLSPSLQIKSLINYLNKNKGELVNKNIFFEDSIHALSDNNISKCIYCGSCLLGCVHSLIYTSKETLQELQLHSNFSYQKGFIVKKFNEKKEIEVICEDQNKNKRIFKCNKLFLGSGFLSTTKIVMNSYETKEKLLLRGIDSQHFIFPVILKKNSLNVEKENLYTLSQLFMILNKSNYKEKSFLQFYSFNDQILNFFKKKLGIFYNFFDFLLKKFLLGRILIVQGFLHSDYSSEAAFVFDKEKNILEVKAISKKNKINKINNIIKLLSNNSMILGFYPLKFFLKISKYGRGYHSGGTFPMKNNPMKIGETDIFGRPYKFNNVHIVDSSIFPSIPAGPITLTVMANSLRIADNFDKIR